MLFRRLFTVVVSMHEAVATEDWYSLMQANTKMPNEVVVAHKAKEDAGGYSVGRRPAQAGGDVIDTPVPSKTDEVAPTLGQHGQTVYQSFIGGVASVVQKTGIPINVPAKQAEQHKETWFDLIMDCLLGWAVWLGLAFIIVTFCYVRNYVPPAPVGDFPMPEYTMNKARFGCLDDAHLCCCAVFFPGIRWADTMAQAQLLTFWPAFALFSGMAMLNVLLSGGIFLFGLFTVCLCVYFRQELRKKLKMTPVWKFGVVLEDFCFFCWCSCCAIAQEAMVVRQAIQHKKEGFEPPVPDIMP